MIPFKNSLLQNYIKKYSLDGLIDNGIMAIKDGIMTTCFRPEREYWATVDIGGLIELKNTGLPDAILADMSPATFIKNLSVLAENITIEYKYFNDHYYSLTIRDANKKKLTYRLCEPEHCCRGKKLICGFDFKKNLDKTFIKEILKTIRATNTKYLAFFVENDKMLMGFNYMQCTELKWELDECLHEGFHNAIYLEVNYFQAIIKNNINFDNAYMQLNSGCIFEFVFEEKDFTSKYWIIGRQIKWGR